MNSKPDADPAPAQASGFQPIVDLLEAAEAVADRLGVTDPIQRDAFRRQVLMSFSGAYMEGCATTVQSPEWVPYLPYYLPRSGPNPDSIYRFAPVDPKGAYRLWGVIGDEIIATVTMRKGGAHLGQRCGPRVDEIDLRALPVDEQGRFSLLLGGEPPRDTDEEWRELHPETDCFMSRYVTKAPHQIEGYCCLERLDRPPAPLAPAPGEVQARMELLARYVLSQIEFLPTYLAQLRARGAADAFIADDQTDYGGLASQLYHYYLFDVRPGEAIILESDLPESCDYWSVQLMDPLARTIDFVLHQSSLNDVQAVADADRRVRCVISLEDPGVPNWLDPAGWTEGVVLWRWNAPSTAPSPTVRRVRLAELGQQMPAGISSFDPAHRRVAMHDRIAFYQSRRR